MSRGTPNPHESRAHFRTWLANNTLGFWKKKKKKKNSFCVNKCATLYSGINKSHSKKKSLSSYFLLGEQIFLAIYTSLLTWVFISFTLLGDIYITAHLSLHLFHSSWRYIHHCSLESSSLSLSNQISSWQLSLRLIL